MILVDTSVVLAYLFEEGRRPDPAFWSQHLAASRLLALEVATRLRAMGRQELAPSVDLLMQRMDFVEITRQTTTWMDHGFQGLTLPIRTVDAIHLSAAVYLRERGTELRVATYDTRLADAAAALGFARA